ncbi:membrane-spanning 4-domains subfamily A member 4A-like isoform X1 [Paramisgurnus dabryanus]|uniref:membrane-spanning 4-domains subfamily A member 4A-like isoform X1 n=1 Tax=Paramisgurnus dabryanus TaxID=90735 RepID=UPI0031F37730
MSSQVISVDNATVVIQVNPQIGQESAAGQDKRRTYYNTPLQRFLVGQPKALGTVQIMIGVVTLLTGIVLGINVPHFLLTVISGINFWGSIIYIITGSLSVAAENKLQSCVVKGSLGMNVVSTITAGVAIILMSMQLHFLQYCRDYRHYDSDSCFNIQVLGGGILAMLLLFSILQFILSITISGFACKATCDTNYSVATFH